MRSRALLFVLLLASCAHGVSRRYALPLSAYEAPLIFPALETVAQNLGYEVYGGQGRVSVTLPDGELLLWTANESDFRLWITPKKEKQSAEDYRELKVKADQVWDLAIELRQKSNVGAAVSINPNVGNTGNQGDANNAQGRQPSNARFPQPANQPFQQQGAGQPFPNSQPQAGGCRSGLDCRSGQFCREYNGTKMCLGGGSSQKGGPCTSSLDCGHMSFCRNGVCD